MRRLFADNKWDLADNLLVAFANCGYWPDGNTKILDFGCGEGGLVYRLRDLGFPAFGFDIHDRVTYRAPSDRGFFGFIANPVADTSNTVVATKSFRLPFDDDAFDIIVSTSVIEHVMDLGPVMAEISRIMKPDGFAFHLYPRKCVTVEPHILVPFASRWQSWWYFYLWGLLGIRNQFQLGFSARQVADANVTYTRTGLRYYTERELIGCSAPYFKAIRFVSDQYYYNADWRVFLRNRMRALLSRHPLQTFASAMKMGALLTEGKPPARLPSPGL